MNENWCCEVYCPDCQGDPEGCFGGGSRTLFFETEKEARERGEDICDNSLWAYRVFDFNLNPENVESRDDD